MYLSRGSEKLFMSPNRTDVYIVPIYLITETRRCIVFGPLD